MDDVTQQRQAAEQQQPQQHSQQHPQQQRQQDSCMRGDMSALRPYSSLPLAVAQGNSGLGPYSSSAQFPMESFPLPIPLSFTVTIPDPLQLHPSAFLDHPDNFGAAQWINNEISQLTSDDLRNCFAEAAAPQLSNVTIEAEDQGSSEQQVAVIQPQVQHVVFRFLTKMRALVARRRVERGEMGSLSSQLDQRLRLRACVSTFQIAKCESSCCQSQIQCAACYEYCWVASCPSAHCCSSCMQRTDQYMLCGHVLPNCLLSDQ